jgi:hypothetical protein
VFPLDQGGLTKQATLSVIADGLPSATGTGGLVRQSNPSFSNGIFVNVINGTSNSGVSVFSAGTSFGASSGGFVGLFGSTHPTSPGLLQLGVNGGGILNVSPTGGVGIGTTAPAAKLHVAPGDVLIDNNYKYLCKDTSGTFAGITVDATNNFVLVGSNSTGAVRVVAYQLQRSDVSPFIFNSPLQIGTSGVPIQNLISTVISSYAPAAIAANGGSQFLDVTVTGASSACACIVSPTSGPITSGVIVKAEVVNTNSVRITWVNTTTSSVTLPSSNYRIVAFVF